MAVVEKELFSAPTSELQGSDQHWGTASMRVEVTGRFENDSVNNHWPSLKRKGLADRDVGSNWTAFESGIEMSSYYLDVITHLSGGIYHGYQGPMLVGHNYNHFDADAFYGLPLGYSTEEDLLGKGTTAISRVIPTNPIVDLPVAIAELLREGVPFAIPGWDIAQKRRLTQGEISGNYLNYEFGMKPFLADLQKFAKAAKRAEELINDYAAKAGKVIRRRYEFPESIETIVNETPASTGFEKFLGGPCNSQIAGYLTPALSGWPGDMRETITRSKKIWYSGAFTYYLPNVGNTFSDRLLREEAEMRHLYGGLSIETAWNLMPYSWAVDWFTNAGDLIHNVAAFARDGLVMPWGYVMERCELHSYREVSNAVIGRMASGYEIDFPDVVSTTYYAKYLRRRKATPFGFGLTNDDFTNRQRYITAALLIK